MKENNSKNILQEYAGLSAQFAVGTAITVYIGIWLDGKMGQLKPIFTWLLPLTFIIGMLYKIIKDNTTNKDPE
ncbi:AtpZ/AtpI family protein [Parasediminibacterium paludis]|uniref:AtpZ/AtpI family protein n=1 Tax=Parasediminibacterium paludis TaxID=908966 RepID=A0ABV8PUT5_9BACT